MAIQYYMNIARGEGYDIKYIGIGMAYVTCRTSVLTDIMDTEKAETQLALIGMAILNDDVRKMLQKG